MPKLRLLWGFDVSVTRVEIKSLVLQKKERTEGGRTPSAFCEAKGILHSRGRLCVLASHQDVEVGHVMCGICFVLFCFVF